MPRIPDKILIFLIHLLEYTPMRTRLKNDICEGSPSLVFVEPRDTGRPRCTQEVETPRVQERWESSLVISSHLEISNIPVEYEGGRSLHIFHIKIYLKRDEDSVAIFLVEVLDILYPELPQSRQVGPDIPEE